MRGLHCLSAFCGSLTTAREWLARVWTVRSPLPFGVLRITDLTEKVNEALRNESSPLPFGVLRITDMRLYVVKPLSGKSSPLPFGVLRITDQTAGRVLKG